MLVKTINQQAPRSTHSNQTLTLLLKMARTAATAKSATKAAEKTTKAMAKALASDDTTNDAPVKTVGKGKAGKGLGKAAKKTDDTTVKVKRTRAPSAFNIYMSKRLAEMKAELAMDADAYPQNHRERFTLAASEWSAMPDEKKAELKNELEAERSRSASPTQTAPPAPPTPKKATATPKKVAPAPKKKKVVPVPVQEEESDAESEDSEEEDVPVPVPVPVAESESEA